MKRALIVITAWLAAGVLYAQERSGLNDSTSDKSRQNISPKQEDAKENADSTKPGYSEQPDSTEGSLGMRGLSTTRGVSTTSGTGGLGTIENTGHNTSSDIYNIERKDSIRKAMEKKRKSQSRKTKKDTHE
jgi:hypothetical protein